THSGTTRGGGGGRVEDRPELLPPRPVGVRPSTGTSSGGSELPCPPPPCPEPPIPLPPGCGTEEGGLGGMAGGGTVASTVGLACSAATPAEPSVPPVPGGDRVAGGCGAPD